MHRKGVGNPRQPPPAIQKTKKSSFPALRRGRPLAACALMISSGGATMDGPMLQPPLANHVLFRTRDLDFARESVAQKFCRHRLDIVGERHLFNASHPMWPAR
jgi:hypothetical protein